MKSERQNWVTNVNMTKSEYQKLAEAAQEQSINMAEAIRRALTAQYGITFRPRKEPPTRRPAHE